MHYVFAYIATAVVFFAIDFVWLSKVSKAFYADRIGHLLLDKPLLGAAAAFYAVYVIGIVIFAVAPALKDGSGLTALMYGALFGFFAYATYDMTNYATLKDWSLTVSIVDTLWGTFLTGISAYLGFLGARLISQLM